MTPTVIASHNGTLTREEQWAAAVLNAGRGAYLAGLTALEVQGLEGWRADRAVLAVPKGGRPPAFGSVQVAVHETRRPAAPVVRRGLPVSRVPRSAVDAASWARTDREACAILAAVVRQRLTVPTALASELDAARRLRRRRLLVGVVGDLAGGAEALSELDFLSFCRRHGLPRPSGQEVRVDRTGRRRYVDAVFTTASGRRLHVEIDGSIHLVESTYWADMRRGNDLALARTVVLRFPSWAVRVDDPSAVAQLREALAR